MKNKLLAAPYIVWMVLFTLIPLGIVFYYALTDSMTGQFTLANLASIGTYLPIFLRSIWLSLFASLICLVIGYPVAYFIAQCKPLTQRFLEMLIMLPMCCLLYTSDHHDDRRRLNGDLRLPAHEFQHFAARTRLDAAGVDEQEAPPVPLAVAVDAVARDARRILHNGHPPPGQFVEQQRFAHIRPPHNGDNGFCHIITSFLRRSQYSADPRNFAPHLVGADDSVRPPPPQRMPSPGGRLSGDQWSPLRSSPELRKHS